MVSVCPAAVVEAPLERVWAVLMDTRSYGEWADADFTRFDPPGPATPGQVLEADAREIGLTFRVRLRVEAVDPDRHQVVFDVALPFGVRERTTITATEVDQRSTRVQFG
jgi:Polyketide cyclase / dehydrase and lipid transport